MGFDDDGFLAADLAAWTTAIRKEYGKWFQLTADVNRDAMKILASIEPSLTKNQELTASLLFRRAVQSFQGAVLMAERGMIADALTLVRSCVETAIALGNVVINPKFVDLLIESHFDALVTYSNVLLNDVESRALLTPEQIDNLEKTIADVKRRYPTSNPQRIKWAQAARNAGMSAAYDMIYRMTSGDAAHVSPNALDRHVQADEHGKIVGLLFQPETRDLERALSFATNALLHAMQAVTRLFRREEFDRTVKSYIDRWDKLEAKLP
jgi:hypothetical protein